MIVVGRHINGITINPLEYLLDDNGGAMKFANEGNAKEFLKRKGYTDEDIYWFVFEKEYLKVGEYTPPTDTAVEKIVREFYRQGLY